VTCHPTGGVHQLETGVYGAVRERAAQLTRPITDPGGRGAQAHHAGQAERLPGGSGG